MMSEIATGISRRFIKRFTTRRGVSRPFPRGPRDYPSPSLLSSGQIEIKQKSTFSKLRVVAGRLIGRINSRINSRREKFTNKFFITDSRHSIQRQLSEHN